MHALQRNAAGGGPVSRLGHMHEDGAAGAADARLGIVAQHNDDVVEAVRAPEMLGAGGIGMLDWPVVVAVSGRVAPAIAGPDLPQGQAGGWAPDAVGAIEHPQQLPAPDGSRPVSLALRRPPAAAAERAGKGAAA